MISASPAVYSVSQLNGYVKKLLDGDEALSTVFVSGEISNFKAHYTGHYYMTLKDDGASVKAVMFASNTARLRFMPENGLKVLVIGRVSLYERDGSYQLYITDMQPDGIGSLNLAFEQLKKKLAAEGLFDEAHKKRIPIFPKRVGVVTSATGAAFRDIQNVIGRRFPAVQIIIKPVLVQGDGAAADIARAIRLFNLHKAADVLIVGRGGGSVEDLWAFNEEPVARAVYESAIPVISAVGHETDFTICDFAADLRAPTPSAAAELCVPDIVTVKNTLDAYSLRQVRALRSRIEFEREKLRALAESSALKNPLDRITDSRQELCALFDKMSASVSGELDSRRATLAACASKLDALSPLAVLARGYSITYKNGRPVSDITSINQGDGIEIRMNNGLLNATVTGINGEYYD